MRLPLLAFLFAAAAPGAPAQETGLDWMSAHWRSAGTDMVIEEFWTDDAGGLMLGGNRTLSGGRAVAFEHLRIEPAPDGNGLRYCAQPGGRPATCFDLVEAGANHARFENPEHDFPQRVEYRRDGDTLTATISDMGRDQSMDFVWQRVTG